MFRIDDINSKSIGPNQQYRQPDQIDPAILSCGPRPTSTPPTGTVKSATQSPTLSNGSETSADIIRYSREKLLGLRNSELSRRKPDYIDDRRLWCRLGSSNGSGDNVDNSGGLSRYEGRSEYHRVKPFTATLSASSSTSSLANSTTSSYLLPSFACKRRPTASTATGTTPDAKDRAGSGLRKESSSVELSSGTRRGGASAAAGNSAGNNVSGGNAGGSGTSEALGRDRRIGSGRIPMRDVSWSDYRSTTVEKDGTTTTSSAAPSTSTTSSNTTTTATANDSDYNFRPSGGLLGLRDRGRVEESQPPPPTHQQHPILPRSLMDKDRNDFRERSSMLSDERFDRRSFSRDFSLGSMDKERNIRGSSNNNHRDHHSGNSNSRFGSNNSHYNNNNSHHQSNSHHHHNDHRRRMYDSRSHAYEEPEWFSGGPTSQNDVIELRGFDDPPPETRPARNTSSAKESSNASSARDNNDSVDDSKDYQHKSKTNTDRNGGDKEQMEDGKGRGKGQGGDFYDEPARRGAKGPNDSNNNTNSDASKKNKAKKRNADSKDNNVENEKTGKGNDGDNKDNDDNDENTNDENFNFEDFLKLDSISDLLSVSYNCLA